jgi:hypothetical protein
MSRRRILADLIWDDAEEKPYIVKHQLTHVEGSGLTWEEALSEFRERQARFFASIHEPHHTGGPEWCDECLDHVARRNRTAALEDMTGVRYGDAKT